MNWKNVAIVLMGSTIVLSVALGIVFYTTRIHTHGHIKAVGCEIYADLAGTKLISEIDWGVLEPDSAINLTVYVKNTGNVPVDMNITTANWNPSTASNYITLYNDLGSVKKIGAGEIVPCILTLKVSPTIMGITSFDFEILFTASG